MTLCGAAMRKPARNPCPAASGSDSSPSAATGCTIRCPETRRPAWRATPSPARQRLTGVPSHRLARPAMVRRRCSSLIPKSPPSSVSMANEARNCGMVWAVASKVGSLARMGEDGGASSSGPSASSLAAVSVAPALPRRIFLRSLSQRSWRLRQWANASRRSASVSKARRVCMGSLSAAVAASPDTARVSRQRQARARARSVHPPAPAPPARRRRGPIARPDRPRLA